MTGTTLAPLADSLLSVGSNTKGSKAIEEQVMSLWVPNFSSGSHFAVMFSTSGNTPRNLVQDKNSLFQDSFSHLSISNALECLALHSEQKLLIPF